MSEIRKRSIKATVWIYIGFFIGAVNTYFLTHRNWFSTDQNGLTRVLIETSQLVYAFSTWGVTSYLYKFFPYYQDNLAKKKNDLLSIALIVSFTGFVITCLGLLLLEPVIVRKFSANSILFIEYFYWIIPMGFCMLLYNVLEAYAYGFEKGVLTSLLRETVIRLYTLVIILLKVFNLINFKSFIILFCFQFATIILWLCIHLYRNDQLWLSFNISRVTRKYRSKILSIMLLTFIVIVVNVMRQSIDGLVLAAKQNLGKVGIFGLAAYMVSVLQAPFRSIVAVTIPVLSRAWKNKNFTEINRIYKRSSINLLSFALFVFFVVWLNFNDGIIFLGINPDYLEGRWVFFLLGIVTIIEMGTGVNGQIIGTSTYWRFELWTSLLLTLMIIPLSYFLTVRYGILGPAFANLVSFSTYNSIRCYFLWKKFGMIPFSIKTIEVILLAIIAYALAYYLFKNNSGLTGIIFRTTTFSALFITGIYSRKISPDFLPVANNLLRRIGFKKN